LFRGLRLLDARLLLDVQTLNAGHLLRLGFLHPTRLFDADTLRTGQLAGAGFLNSGGFLRPDTLGPGKFASLRLLTSKLGGAVDTKLLRGLFKRLLRAGSLDACQTV
jgi:hypothetical protein